MKLINNYHDDFIDKIYITDRQNKHYWFVPFEIFCNAMVWDIKKFTKIDLNNKEEILRIFD